MRLGVVAVLLLGCAGDDVEPTGDTGPVEDTDPVTTSTGPERVQTILALTPDETAGAQTFAQNCEFCHMADGTGGPDGANLTERLVPMSDDDVVSTILEGIGDMDSYRSLKNQQISDVAAYIRTQFGS